MLHKARRSSARDFGAALSICIIGVIMAALIMQDIYSMALDSVTDQLNSGSRALSSFVQLRMRTTRRLSVLLRTHLESDTQDPDFEDLTEYLNPFQDANVFDMIALCDIKGNVYTPYNTYFRPDSLGIFEKTLNGETYVICPADDESSGQRLLFCSPLYYHDKIIGAVCGVEDVSAIYDRIPTSFYSGHGCCYVLDNDGNVFFPDNLRDPGYKLENIFDGIQIQNDAEKAQQSIDVLRRHLERGETGVMMLNLLGNRTLLGYAPVTSYSEWNIVGIVKMSSIMSECAPLITKMLLLTVVSVVILLIFARSGKRAALVLEKAAFYDDVTGCYNFKYFTHHAPDILKSRKSDEYAILRLGIRKFKYFNSNFGYQLGDKLLQSIQTQLNSFFPESEGNISAHVHSDEFVVLFKRPANIDSCISNLNSVLENAARPLGIDRQVSYTYGVYILNDDETGSLMELVEKAALAQSHYSTNPFEHGWLFNEKMIETVNINSKLESIMEQSLAKGEFIIYIQPKIDLATQCATGGEALVRWQNPELGFLPPSQFIPLFERNGFIQSLDFYMLENAIRYLDERIKNKLPTITIAVNQSRQDCFNPNYLERLHTLLKKYDVPAYYIELEITESMVLEDMEKMSATISALRKMGFLISIDDFGAGYTSIRFLQRIEVDVIKIDRSLIVSATTSPRKYSVLKSLIEMLHALNVTVVCEGVETEEQLAMVRRIRGDVVQGYYYAKPMPIENFDRFLENSAAPQADERSVSAP